MTVIACKDFIDEEILTFTEDNPLDPRYGYDPRDRFVRTRIVGKRSEQDFGTTPLLYAWMRMIW